MLSAIQVIEHVFTNFSVKAHADPAKDTGHTAKYGVKATRQKEHEERVWRVDLFYTFGKDKKEGKPPYEGTIELHGYFLIHPDFPEEKCESLARMNGGAVLMGAVREAVLGHTLRSINGPLELPLVDARTFLPQEKREGSVTPSEVKEEQSEE